VRNTEVASAVILAYEMIDRRRCNCKRPHSETGQPQPSSSWHLEAGNRSALRLLCLSSSFVQLEIRFVERGICLIATLYSLAAAFQRLMLL